MLDPTKALPPDSRAALALERGRTRRREVPRRSHGVWATGADRPDPVATLTASNEGRLPALVPIRMGRMLASPFALLRGSAAIMAADLATTPTIGSMAQLCGDAHLANFGVYRQPGTASRVRPQRLRRDVSRAVGMGPQAARGERRRRVARERLSRGHLPRHRPGGRSRVSPLDPARTPRCAPSRSGTPRSRSSTILERVEQARAAGETRVGLDFSMEEAQRKDHLAALGKLSIKAPGGGYLIRDRPPLIVRAAR